MITSIRLGLIGAHILLLWLLCGCATTNPDTVQRVAVLTKVAANIGTFEALRSHPEWRPAFQEAASQLAIIETAETIDLPTIVAIIQRLPVKQLQSDRAGIYIIGATILIQEFGGDGFALDQLTQLKPIAKALREGIELGLQ